MKPFLGINITENKKNEVFNGDEFIVQKTSEYMTAAFEKSADNAGELLEKSELPLLLRIIEWVTGIVAMLLFTGLVKAIGDEDGITFSEAYNNAAWVFWVAGASLLIWLIIFLLGHRKQAKVLDSEESDNVLGSLDEISENIYSELNVPENAAEIDILSFKYKIKKRIPVPCETGFDLTAYNNLIYKIYADSNNLYLADLECKYAFPLSEIRGITTVKKRISVSSWNKDTECNKGEYKQYKMHEDDYGRVNFKTYHILNLLHNGEEWGIYFPCYELPAIEAATGISAEK